MIKKIYLKQQAALNPQFAGLEISFFVIKGTESLNLSNGTKTNKNSTLNWRLVSKNTIPILNILVAM